jgi:hypothetical protein
MEKKELIITTAKDIFLKFGSSFFGGMPSERTTPKDFDDKFKAIVKSISEAYENIKTSDLTNLV